MMEYEDIDTYKQENALLKQKLEDVRYLYEKLLSNVQHEGETVDHRKLRILQAKNIQLERQNKRLVELTQIRSACINEMENFAYEIKGMIKEDDLQATGRTTNSDLFTNPNSHDNNVLDPKYLHRWTSAIIDRLKSYKQIRKAAEDQQYFYGPNIFVDENDGHIDTRTHSKNLQRLFKGDIPFLDVTQVANMENTLNELHLYLTQLYYRTKQSIINSKVNPEELEKQTILELVNDCSNKIDTLRQSMVEFSMIVPSKTKPIATYDVTESGDQEPTMNLKLNAKEIMKKLPKSSRNRSETEQLLKGLVNCMHAKQHIWKQEKRALKAEVKHKTQMYNMMNTFNEDFMRDIEHIHQNVFGSAEIPSNSSQPSYSQSIFGQLCDIFEAFDRESNEENLRNLLMYLKENLNTLQEGATSGGSTPSQANHHETRKKLIAYRQQLETAHDRHEKHMDKISQTLYKHENAFQNHAHDAFDIIGSYTPYMVPVSRSGNKSSRVFSNVHASTKPVTSTRQKRKSTSRYSQPTQPVEPISTKSDVSYMDLSSENAYDILNEPHQRTSGRNTRPRRKSAQKKIIEKRENEAATERLVTKATERTKPPISTQQKTPSASINSNQHEVEIQLHELQAEIEQMTHDYENAPLTKMQLYALKKNIARKNAAFKRLQRTMAQLEK